MQFVEGLCRFDFLGRCLVVLGFGPHTSLSFTYLRANDSSRRQELRMPETSSTLFDFESIDPQINQKTVPILDNDRQKPKSNRPTTRRTAFGVSEIDLQIGKGEQFSNLLNYITLVYLL